MKSPWENYWDFLKRLHRVNAWLVVLLGISGLLLMWEPLRGLLQGGRVALKWLHIGLGLLSVLVVLSYAPYIVRHIRRLRKQTAKRWNLAVVLFIMTGWIVSGLILWLHKSFPPAWSSAMLLAHDAFTWIGLPYAIYHSITRSRWLKRQEALLHKSAQSQAAQAKHVDEPETNRPIVAPRPLYTRRGFLRWGVAALLAIVLGPRLFRWISGEIGGGGGTVKEALERSGNRMIPDPKPAAESMPPIGGGARGDFRIYTVTRIPSFTNENWSFQVDGLVEKPLQWNWDQFLSLERKVQISDFHCVTGWSVYQLTWEGITVSKLLELAGVKPEAKQVKFYSGDKVYTDTLTLDQAGLEDIMVAVLMDGKPIPQDLGGPVRLIVPRMYAYKSVKWLERIELIEKEHIGYWEARGYDSDAWVPGKRV